MLFFCFLHRPSGALEPRRRFTLSGRQLFSAPAERGDANCHRRVRPIRAAPFQHRLSGACELPLACSSLTGGEFFAEPQRGDSPSADGGSVPRPAAGQEGRHQGFYPLNSHFLLGESGADCRHVTAAKRGTAEDFFYRRGAQCAPMPKPIRSAGYRTATQAVYSAQAQHNSVAQLVSLEIMDGTYESIYLVAFILAGPVYNNALKNRAALLCRTQRRVARMCSSNLSVNCEYVAKQTLR